MVDKIQQAASLLPDPVKTSGKHGSEKSDPFRGLNLDKFGLSEDAQNKVMWARSQFEVNYQVINSINSSQGRETFQESFSFKASYEFLQQASGQEPIKSENTESTQETSAQDALSQLQDYFSPENTALRILDVATSFFSLSEVAKSAGNTEAARKSFAEFIGGAIDIGFAQAREQLGELPENITNGIEKTHSLIADGLADFIINGIDPEKSRPGGVFEKIAAYGLESKNRVETSSKSTSGVSYTSGGDTKETSTDTPKISTKG